MVRLRFSFITLVDRIFTSFIQRAFTSFSDAPAENAAISCLYHRRNGD